MLRLLVSAKLTKMTLTMHVEPVQVTVSNDIMVLTLLQLGEQQKDTCCVVPVHYSDSYPHRTDR